jgi:DNA polymerase I-like protein with 3'-5' exonuclease and polymerase domains
MSVKNHFTSRFEGGSIVEMDFSQLEVIGLAILSKDVNLKQDIARGLDLHSANTATLHGVDYQYVCDQVDKNKSEWVQKRKVVKIFSFQLQYGAGAKSMAESAGVSLSMAKDFIDTYYTRYPGVKQWQDETIQKVKDAAQPTNRKTPRGFPAAKSFLTSPTGRWYTFYEQDAPEFMRDRGEDTSFSPTQIKNYPVQGFSTGDVVPLALGKVFRYLLHTESNDRIKFVNTVHDSLIFDVHPDLDIQVLRDIKQILEGMPEQINYLWPEVHFDLPLRAGVEMGPSWGECKPVDIGE